MNSAGHKANILESSYIGIGVGAVKIDGVCYWVQLFTSQTPDVASASAYANETTVTDVVFTKNDEEFEILPTVTKLSLEYGEKETVGLKFYNTYYYTALNEGQLTFSSEDPSVCSVATSGEVTAVGVGSTNIQVTMTKYPQITASIPVTVSKAKLVASYEGETIAYGDTPKLTVTVTGFVNGDTEATAAGYTAPTVRNKNTDVGSYRLLPSGGAASNYSFRYTSGTLTIEPALVLNAYSLRLQKGQATSALKVTRMAKGDYVKSVESSKPEIVRVTSFKKTGKISLKAQNRTGSAKLTVTLASGLKKTVKVKVQKNTVKTKKLTVSSKKITLKKGKSKTLKVTLNPITSQQKVTYKSSNKKVATVNADGKITAKKAGTAKITIQSGSKKVVVTVRVKK